MTGRRGTRMCIYTKKGLDEAPFISPLLLLTDIHTDKSKHRPCPGRLIQRRAKKSIKESKDQKRRQIVHTKSCKSQKQEAILIFPLFLFFFVCVGRWYIESVKHPKAENGNEDKPPPSPPPLPPSSLPSGRTHASVHQGARKQKELKKIEERPTRKVRAICVTSFQKFLPTKQVFCYVPSHVSI